MTTLTPAAFCSAGGATGRCMWSPPIMRRTHETIVITVYEPDLALWEDGFKRRRT